MQTWFTTVYSDVLKACMCPIGHAPPAAIGRYSAPRSCFPNNINSGLCKATVREWRTAGGRAAVGERRKLRSRIGFRITVPRIARQPPIACSRQATASGGLMILLLCSSYTVRRYSVKSSSRGTPAPGECPMPGAWYTRRQN